LDIASSISPEWQQRVLFKSTARLCRGLPLLNSSLLEALNKTEKKVCISAIRTAPEAGHDDITSGSAFVFYARLSESE
jgi:hypothetical protein